MAQSGYTPLSLYYSATASTAPLAANLVAGELALNTNDGKLYYKDSSGVVQVLATKASSSGSFGALTATSITNSGLTSGRVVYTTTGGLETTSANLTFNGTTLTLANDASISGLTVGKGTGSQSNNTAVGNGALAGSNSAGDNTAIGTNALNANTSGTYNVGLGGFALALNTTGSYNTAIGRQALYANTASFNTGIGTLALAANTTGAYNTALGYNSLYANTTASSNTAVGYQSLYANTNSGNTAIGYQAATATTTGGGTVALGNVALTTNTTGDQNTAIGAGALKLNTTGSYNSALGYLALQANTTASNNTAVGYQAGYTSTAANNTTIGYKAGYALAGGDYCCYIGDNAGVAATTGRGNTFVGTGYAGGSGSAITTGGRNTIVGAYTGNQGGLDIRTASNYIVLSDGDGNPRGIFDGSGNFYVGKSTYSDTSGNGFGVFPNSGIPQVSCVGAANSTQKNFTVYSSTDSAYKFYVNYAGGGYFAGNLLIGTTNNNPVASNAAGVSIFNNGEIHVANTGGSEMECLTSSGAHIYFYTYNGSSRSSAGNISSNGGTTSYNGTSDYRLKENVAPLTGALSTISKLKPVTFIWKGDSRNDNGFIAHELQEVLPNAVTGEKDAIDAEGNPIYQGIDPRNIVATLTAAIQEQQAMIETLTTRLNALEGK